MERELPLSGIRVVDFTWAAAGPYGTLLLASLGAEVTKITSSRATGGFPPQRAADLNRFLNYNKMSLTLDLTNAEGSELAKDVIKVSDLVMENYRPGTMHKFGLDYGELIKVNPSIVMVSSSSFGGDGPLSRTAGFAPIFGATSGLSYITGYIDGVPTDFRIVVDYTVGQMSAYAALVGLYHQRLTGEGQYIDLASRDAVTSLLGEVMLDAQLNGPQPNRRNGNHDGVMAPHNVYMCKGNDAWISIAVANDREWESLCRVAGHQEWASDERFSDGDRRTRHQTELDELLSEWTVHHGPFELMEKLQKEGVAAVPSYTAKDMFEDPHLKQRDVTDDVTAPSGERYTVLTAPWVLDGERPGARRHAPSPGDDNYAVLGDLLGIPSAEIDRLIDAGVAR